MHKVERLLEVVGTAGILLFLGPLIVLHWCCQRVLAFLDLLSFPEVVTFLVKVMTGEEKLQKPYNLFNKERERIAAE